MAGPAVPPTTALDHDGQSKALLK